MFNRPRCREWIPLATQQQRLRNLIKISGHNILCSLNAKLYYTLSIPSPTQTQNELIYKSEIINIHNIGQKLEWQEINCIKLVKSNHRCVCISVWECTTTPRNPSKEQNHTVNKDVHLFRWCVNFSGLMLISKLADTIFLENSLVFEMNGGIFVSPEKIESDSLREQLCFSYQNENLFNDDTSTIDALRDKNDIILLSDTGNEKNTVCKQLSMNSENYSINSPKTSRSGSPTRKMEFNSNPNNMIRNLIGMANIRYIKKIVTKSEIRKSCCLEKLLRLQDMQRKCKQVNLHAKSIMEEICTRSAYCLNQKCISTSKFIICRNKGNPSMGRALNRLLFQENIINAEDLLKAKNLETDIESACYKTRLLLNEDSNLKNRKEKFMKTLLLKQDDRKNLELLLQLHLNNIDQIKDLLMVEKGSMQEQKKKLKDIQAILMQRKFQLCNELKDIYTIERRDNSYTINNITLPNADNLSIDSKNLNLGITWEQMSPLALSVSLGYVAHIVQMASIILDTPLRNPIHYEGSRSRITDTVKEIPNTSREFPLYCRTSIPTSPVRYAVYLLNQNISQMNYSVKGIKCELRATLPSLLQLLNSSSIGENFISAPSLLIQQASIACTLSATPAIEINARNKTSKHLNSQRISRSAGSYSEEEEMILRTNDRKSYKSESGL